MNEARRATPSARRMASGCMGMRMSANEAIRVILVEDDEPLQASLVNFLELSGFALTAVADGVSFYRALADATFDVAVVDLGLPDQSGETLIEYLRQNTTTPIIVVTARDTLDTRVGCYRTGADLFLAKPIDGRELAAAIASLAGRRRAEGQQAAMSVPGEANSTATGKATGAAMAAATVRTTDSATGNAVSAIATEVCWVMSAARRSLVNSNGKSVVLTAREWQLLATIADNPGRTTDRYVLMGLIYGREDVSAAHALETLVYRTRQKVAESTGVGNVILTDYGSGYRFGGTVVIRQG